MSITSKERGKLLAIYSPLERASVPAVVREEGALPLS